MKKLFAIVATLFCSQFEQPLLAQDDDDTLSNALPIAGSCTGHVPVMVNCTGSGTFGGNQYILEDEWDIVNTLCWYKAQGQSLCNVPETLYFSPNTTYKMGLIPPDYFPIEVPPGIVLMGDFDIGIINPNNTSFGTHIYFPYLYELGWANYNTDVRNSPCYDYENQAAIFKLYDGAQIHHVSFEGAKMDTKDWRYYDDVDSCNNQHIPTWEGLSSGILVVGNNCEISHCEIMGFPLFGVLVRDMLETGSSGQITTLTDCYDNNTPKGKFTFHHNYVHNNKAYGYGYGIWISAGGQDDCTPNAASHSCYDDATNFWNFNSPEEEGEIHNNVFFDNKHDIASSGNRTSLNIHDNTFSHRNSAPNINMHDGVAKWVCNPMGYNGPAHRANATTVFSYEQMIFNQIGGSVNKIANNSFYGYGLGVQLPYPNINECEFNQNNYAWDMARIEIEGNYFTTSTQCKAANGTNLFWPDPTGVDFQKGYYRISIGDEPFYKYRFFTFNGIGDDHIQIDESASILPNVVETSPLPALSNTPVAGIASTVQNSGVASNALPKKISQNKTILFDTHLCQDADRNQPPAHPMLNMWRFGDSPTPYDDVRTDNSNNGTPIAHTFYEAGICNVTLMSIDVYSNTVNPNREYHSSDIVQQQITVQPAYPGVYLIFNIKDTYVGNTLTAYPHITATGTGNYTTTNGVYSAQTDQPDLTETRFVKYAKINNTIVWQDDIAGDEGWQHVVINIGTTAPIYGNSADVEIGLMAVTNAAGKGPDASIVKGVTIYIDDVYVNNPDGSNALANGDFEQHKTYPTDPTDAVDGLPAAWNYFEEAQNNMSTVNLNQYTDQCGWDAGTVFYHATRGTGLSTDEVHSGLAAWTAWVRPFNDDYFDDHYETGLYYNAPGRYKAVRQKYNWGLHQLAKGEFTLYVQPNPSLSGNTVNIYCTGYESQNKTLTVYSAQGNEVVKTAFDGEQYTLNQNLKPGVYIVTIECQGQQEKKKLVITN